MHRRTWIKAVGAAVGTHFMVSRPATAQDSTAAIQPKTVQLLDPASFASAGLNAPAQLQDVQLHDNRLYYLSGVALSPHYEVGSVGLDGTAIRRSTLPLGAYLALGISDTGMPIIHRLTGFQDKPPYSFYTVDTNTNPATLDWLGALTPGGRTFFLDGSHCCRIVNRDTLELYALDQIAGGPASTFSLPSKVGRQFDLLALGSGRLIVVNFETGDLTDIDLVRSSVTLRPPSDPDIQNRLVQLQRRAAKRGNPSIRLLVACGQTGTQEISALVGPIPTNRVARLARYNSSTLTVSGNASVYLHSFPAGTPMRLFGIDNNIAVVYSNGLVDAFAV